MTAPQTIDRATDSPDRAALRLLTRHQLRAGPGAPRCGFCRGVWLPRGVAGRLVDGCAARQLAVAALVRLFVELSPAGPSPTAGGATDARA
ncbi:MAG TPA: hypothetical protein VJT31_22200 [Rugosimonospora sp.]|nr:hypothetical protein [Rugosimonospora sp.]